MKREKAEGGNGLVVENLEATGIFWDIKKMTKMANMILYETGTKFSMVLILFTVALNFMPFTSLEGL